MHSTCNLPMGYLYLPWPETFTRCWKARKHPKHPKIKNVPLIRQIGNHHFDAQFSLGIFLQNLWVSTHLIIFVSWRLKVVTSFSNSFALPTIWVPKDPNTPRHHNPNSLHANLRKSRKKNHRNHERNDEDMTRTTYLWKWVICSTQRMYIDTKKLHLFWKHITCQIHSTTSSFDNQMLKYLKLKKQCQWWPARAKDQRAPCSMAGFWSTTRETSCYARAQWTNVLTLYVACIRWCVAEEFFWICAICCCNSGFSNFRTWCQSVSLAILPTGGCVMTAPMMCN